MWATRTALGLCLLTFAVSAPAVSKDELDQRLRQLERRLDSRGLLELMRSVEMLRGDLQQLRGEIEVQNNSLRSMQKRQRDLYMDIDRRLYRLEHDGEDPPADTAAYQSSAPAGAVPPAPAAPPAHPGATAVPPVPGVAPQSRNSAVAPTGAVPLTNASADPAVERKAYDHALGVLQDGRYPEAAKSFKAFLVQYPGSEYADNAQYWLGEVYYVGRQFKEAQVEFGRVITEYPQSPKVPDAKLKTGYIQYELRDWDGARATFSELVESHPGTTAARLAQERLDRMKREKR